MKDTVQWKAAKYFEKAAVLTMDFIGETFISELLRFIRHNKSQNKEITGMTDGLTVWLENFEG